MDKSKEHVLDDHRNLNNDPKFLAVDFFCGAGGTSRGLIDASGYLIAGIDNDPRCERTFLDNNVNINLDCGTPHFLGFDIFPKTKDYPEGEQHEIIRILDFLIQRYRKLYPDLPLLFAICAPCQPFTGLARKKLTPQRKAARHRDSYLLMEALKFVRRFNPELILSENVPGINNTRYGGVWKNFCDGISHLGYASGSKVVCASRFGIPQFRKRTILLAARDDVIHRNKLKYFQSNELVIPECDPNAEIVSVKQAIDHLPPISAGDSHPNIPNHRTRNLSDLNLRRLTVAKPGQNNASMENTPYGDLSLKCHQGLYERFGKNCFSDVYTRMHPDRPSPTITTKCHSISNGRFGHYDPRQVRGISLREAAILQSFPESYVFHPVETTEPVARMIGNAVPPKLAGFFANYLAGMAIAQS